MTKLYKNILFAAAALVMPSALADIPESSVPAAAVSSIKGAYPNAGFIEWDSEMHGLKKIYEAEFKINGFQFDVKIAPDGKIVRIKEEMAVSHLFLKFMCILHVAIARLTGAFIQLQPDMHPELLSFHLHFLWKL